ncbi:MAG: hypothetical protein QOH72_5406 [Solirubrobacteraceae bacterium]|nr:hypothetical protein [Solirubrobacteraceae bacterium]
MRATWRAAALAAAFLLIPAGTTSVAAAAAPTVVPLPPANVAVATATLRGTINPRGLATTYFFQYGPTTAYGARTAVAAAGAGAAGVTVTAAAGALVPATTYHLRLVAQNASGASATPDRTFRTPAQALSIALVATPNPVPFGSIFSITGTATGAAAAGRPVQIQQRPFPFAGGFANVGPVRTTDASGHVGVAMLSLPFTTQFRAVVTDRPGVVSPVLAVGALPIVATRVSSTRVRRGGRVHFSGTVRPSEPGRGIAIQKRRNGRWITVAGTVERASGATVASYGKTVRVRRGGVFRVFLGTGSGATVPTAARTIRISTRR